MKRYAVVIISLLSVVGLVTVVYGSIRRGQAMQVRFNKLDHPKQEVHIITSADATFEATASSYFKGESKQQQRETEPFSIFIKNSGKRTVVAYMLVWQLVKADGQILTNRTAYAEPAILMGEQRSNDPRFKHTQAIEPNKVRCFSWSSRIAGSDDDAGIGGAQQQPSQRREGGNEPDSAMRARLTTELEQAASLTVSLDGVFFDDGSFVGPNTTGYFERMQAQVQARHDLIKDITVAASQGREDEVFESINAISREPDQIITSTASPSDYYSYYRKLFASELSGMKSFYGTQKLIPHVTRLHNSAHPILQKEVWEER